MSINDWKPLPLFKSSRQICDELGFVVGDQIKDVDRGTILTLSAIGEREVLAITPTGDERSVSLSFRLWEKFNQSLLSDNQDQC